jgi:hypothetical protein
MLGQLAQATLVSLIFINKKERQNARITKKKLVYTSFVLNVNTIEPSKSVTSNLNKRHTLQHVHTTQINVQHLLIVNNKPFEAHICLFQSIATSLSMGW